MAASFLARLAGLDRVVSFDMGGTTAKMCLVENGAPDHKFDFEAGRVRRFVKGSGLPLKVSVVDMIEIGAGGGSIARLEPCVRPDEGRAAQRRRQARPGLLRPRRQRADGDRRRPGAGPARPRLFPGRRDAARARSRARRLRATASRAALRLLDRWTPRSGVQRIVDETMAAATRMHLAEKGRDPRRYTLVAFGGAGPVHAYNLARLLKMRRVVVPLGAGVASALGFLVAPPATDMVRSYVGAHRAAGLGQLVNALFAEMASEGRKLLVEAGADPAAIALRPSADMRHVGQGFEIPVPLPALKLGDGDLAGDPRRLLRELSRALRPHRDGLPRSRR